MKYSEDMGLVASTGTAIDANSSIVGIDPNLEVFGGYDDARVDLDLTQAERIELADYMIAKWLEYRKREFHKAGSQRGC